MVKSKRSKASTQKIERRLTTLAKAKNRARAPRSLSLIRDGLRTSNELALVFTAVMCDVIESRLSTSQGNAVSNVGGKLLKTKEMEFRHGKLDPKTQQKVFLLTV